MKQNYDIIIVGAGIAGLACAQKCSESNRDFLLIEKSGSHLMMKKENGLKIQ